MQDSNGFYDGRVAFVTGGARGFGREFGRALAGHGAAVALADVDRDAVEATAAELSAAGHRVIAVECDVADESRVREAVGAAVDELGGIDILINNAGLHLTKYNRPFKEQSSADIRALFDVNVMGIIHCTLACRESMSGTDGAAVLNISSMASHTSASPYGVSKLAVRGLTLAFAKELADDGIRVNAISPGLQATESAMADLPPELVSQIVEEMQMIHRLGTTADIVDAMLFLCSDRASFITGVTVPVTGGAMLGI